MVPAEPRADVSSEDGRLHRKSRAFTPSLERFNAFSDGVFAIAITLLVLELPIPPETAAVVPTLLGAWHVFLGYLISFAFIGGMWLTHSSLTRMMKACDIASSGLNLVLLLFVAVLPFSTNLMATHLNSPDVQAAVLIYGVNVLLASLTLSMLMFYVAKEPTLVVDVIADESLRRLYRQRWFVIGINVFALFVALLSPVVAVALYLVTTVAVLVFPLLGLRHHMDAPGSGAEVRS